MQKTFPIRFWNRVKKGTPQQCWEWQGFRQTSIGGYGTVYMGRRFLTHRVAWELTNGPIPDGLCVLHKCDNPPCCNPNHLFLGTRPDNVADMIAKGRDKNATCRGKFGESGHNSKLTEVQARDILARYQRGSGWKFRGNTVLLAKEYGVHTSTITNLVGGKTWPNLHGY